MATPYTCLASGSYIVRCVYSSGTLSYHSAFYGHFGVRPICKLSDDTLVEVPGESKTVEDTGDITELIKRWAEEKNLAQRSYDQHIYRLIQNISDLTRHIEEEDYDEAKHDLGYIYTKLIILAQKLSVTDDEDYTSFLINEIEAGRSIW